MIEGMIDRHEDAVEILAALDELPEERFTPKLALYQSQCCNLQAMLDGDIRPAADASGILFELEPEQHDAEYSFQIAIVQYLTFARAAALDNLKIVDSLRPGQWQVSIMMDRCRDFLTRPVISPCTRKRIDKCWDVIFEGTPKMADLVSRIQHSRTRESEAAAEFSTFFREAVMEAINEVHMVVGITGKQPAAEFTMTGNGTLEQMYADFSLVSSMPESLREEWRFELGYKEQISCLEDMPGLKRKAEEIQIWVEDTGRSRVHLYIRGGDFGPDSDGETLRRAVSFALGDAASLLLVEDITAVRKPLPGEPVSLLSLKSTLQNMGYPVPADAAELAESCLLRWEETPDPRREDQLRGDICRYASRLPGLEQEFRESGRSIGDHPISDRLNVAGASAGFLCFPAGSSLSETMRQAENLSAVLLRAAGRESIQPTGFCAGTRRGYVDFIAWDLETILTAAEICLKRTPLQWCLYHSFFREGKCVPLKGDPPQFTAAGPEPGSGEEEETAAPKKETAPHVRKVKKKKKKR